MAHRRTGYLNADTFRRFTCQAPSSPPCSTACETGCDRREVIEMGEEGKPKDDDKPGRHEDDREGQVHEDTAKNIDPSKYDPDKKNDDD